MGLLLKKRERPRQRSGAGPRAGPGPRQGEGAHAGAGAGARPQPHAQRLQQVRPARRRPHARAVPTRQGLVQCQGGKSSSTGRGWFEE